MKLRTLFISASAALLLLTAACGKTEYHKVTFNFDDGVSAARVLTVADGGSAIAPAAARDGYVFDGWDGDCSDVTSDTTLTARWTKLCAVTFDFGEGKTAVQYVRCGESAIAPAAAREGYDFDGWSGECANVTSDTTLTARWTKLCAVTFDFGEGKTAVQYVRCGGSAIAPAASREGYDFDGWSGDCSDVTSDTTLTACWTKRADAPMTAQEIYDKASLATVEIRVYDSNDELISLGSGFFIASDGTILTNYHVIQSGSGFVAVNDGITCSVTSVLGINISCDLAVLATDAENTPYLELCETDPRVGDTVYALGSSRGLTGTFSSGIVSTVSRVTEGIDCIQITAPISKGNSGGPLLDSYCRVLGVNSMSLTTGQNINFAVKISYLSTVKLYSPDTADISSAGFSALPYDSSVAESEPNGSAATATPIAPDDTGVGELSDLSDADWYSLDARAGSLRCFLITLPLQQSQRCRLELRSASGELLGEGTARTLDGVDVLYAHAELSADQKVFILVASDGENAPSTPLQYGVFAYNH